MRDHHILHFAFGPVQSFVAQARRTRDLWAGSYLLSWLAGQAMKSVVEQGGKILLPDIRQDALFQQIRASRPITMEDPAAWLGSLPNRFTVHLPANQDGRICENAVGKSWECIVNAVHNIVNQGFTQDNEVIWNRQTQQCWDFNWVIGEASYLLDQRKNLRLHLPPDEPGGKCTLCGERQELSARKETGRRNIQDWWKNLISTTTQIHGLDLKENERLCAICLIKRIFPRVAENAIGWQVPEFYPSTSYIAAVDWIIHLLDTAAGQPDVAEATGELLASVKDRIVSRAEGRTWARFRGIREGVGAVPSLEKIMFVDGDVFFQDALRSKDLLLSNKKEVLGRLKTVQNVLKKTDPHRAQASPFYSLLLMDGDNMGALIGDRSTEEREKISRALSRFTAKVPAIIDAHNGMLLYAGGDDVFALLPISTALECARLCRVAYQCSFREEAPFIHPVLATISAAIEYAHMNTALGVVVRDAHRLLEDIAKDRTGRDAIACRVWKRGGPVLTWTQPWSLVDDGSLIVEIMDDFTNRPGDPDSFSSSFFYRLQSLFDLVNTDTFQNNNGAATDLLITEYLGNRDYAWPSGTTLAEKHTQAREKIDRLLRLCHLHTRKVEKQYETFTSMGYSDDGALLVRFLVQKEV